MTLMYALITFCLAFLLSVAFTGIEIPILKKKQYGQFIREEGPESHLSKAGTPTMGGLAIYLAIAASAALMGALKGEDPLQMVGMILCGAAFGFIGATDDYIKVAKKHNLGLKAGQKVVLQLLFGIGFSVFAMKCMAPGTNVVLPVTGTVLDVKFLFVPFITFVLLAMSNSVNLTDGLDGLCAGVSGIVALAFSVVVYLLLNRAGVPSFAGPDALIYLLSLAGASFGFLVWNRNPAKIFMGDTGSMALGAGLTAGACACGIELLLPVAGFIFVAEAVSVIIQVLYFKKTGGKRFFRMAPIHHHFELGGMDEKNVVRMFWGFAAACSIVMILISGVL